MADEATANPGGRWFDLRKSVDARMIQLETDRYSWWVHWREIADYVLPRRYRWLITPNQWNRGSPINQRIIDNTATIAARTCAAGMMSGICSPARPWVLLETVNPDLIDQDDVRQWLDDTAKRILMVMATSNYYTAKAMQFLDLVVFGTAPMIIYEDLKGPNAKIIRCFNPCAGEYYCAASNNFTVDTLYRKFVMTIRQVVQEFGLDSLPQDLQNGYTGQGAGMDREVIVCHAIEPNPDFMAQGGPITKNGIPAEFAFQECFWVFGSGDASMLRVKGFRLQPFSVPRWDVTGNDAYGRSPAMDALGDTKQLQVQQKRKAQAIDKLVNPPMVADVALKNTPASLNPGDVTYVSGGKEGVGFKPVFEVQARIAELSEDMSQAQARINKTFYTDLFMMISQLDTVRSAAEIDARQQEKLMALGPVLERFNSEGLDPDVGRIYGILLLNGMLLPVPQALKGQAIKPVYVSALADQQRATITTSIERLMAFIGSVQGVVQSAIDKVDVDVMIEAYGEALHVPAKILRTGAALAKVRAARAKQEADQAQAGAAQAAVQAAQGLSQTDVGGGQNALQMMLSGQGAPAPGQAQAA